MLDNLEDLDDLVSDEFLDSLDEEENKSRQEVSKPHWVKGGNHTTHKAWEAILTLKKEKESNILTFGKIATSKTLKSVYQIKKSDVANIVGITAQSIFSSSSFSSEITDFLNEINASLLEIHTQEQGKQKKRYTTGMRSKKKEDVVSEYQQLRSRVRELECRNVEETLELLIRQLPFDLANRLKR
ncbi:hypothetical protein HYN94_10850 [Vibrio parahaemolyticus]|nr:hypothetical protein [Vibrio parahaemolyticus]